MSEQKTKDCAGSWTSQDKAFDVCLFVPLKFSRFHNQFLIIIMMEQISLYFNKNVCTVFAIYWSVSLFKNKPTGPHEVDFLIGNGRGYFITNKISFPKKGGLEREAYYKKTTSKQEAYERGGLIEL